MEDIELFKMTEYKSCRIGPNGKPKWYIVDENGNLVNRRYNNTDLKNLKILEKERRKYSEQD